jgi:ribosome recycling factor
VLWATGAKEILTPQNDGEIIRLPMPALTEDRRKELVKIAKKYGDECKVTIRHARHEAKDALTQLEGDGEASADEIEQANKKVEDIVKDGTGKADEIVARKEKDILEV